MSNTVLQIILILNAALAGAGIAIGVRHAYAHFYPHKHDAERKKSDQPVVKLPPELRAQLIEEAAGKYRKILDDAASQLQLDMGKTATALNKELAVLGNQIITDEMTRYRASLDELQKHTEQAITSTQEELAKHDESLRAAMSENQEQLMAKMQEQVEAERAKLIAQIDGKLADAAASFLIEALQHDVDLGAQVKYLTGMIESHKDEFKTEVGHESPAAK